jgi:putative membrane protein
MYIKRNYGFFMTFLWSKNPFIFGAIYAAVISAFYLYANVYIPLPWQPISLLGIAVAFYLGFKNNSSYDRTWEARKIWGGIVNNSRSFATAVLTMIDSGKDIDNLQFHGSMIYRHIAWLQSLQLQLRQSRPWEHKDEYIKSIVGTDVDVNFSGRICSAIAPLITEKERQSYEGKPNVASMILHTQSLELQKALKAGWIDSTQQKRIHELIGELYNEQGRSERIKNFPFPRQYASAAMWLSIVFSALVPFGLLPILVESDVHPWWNVPLSAMVIWVFFLMEKIGDYSENPFEGTFNDVPITAISRSIEIDLRHMLGEAEIPEPIKDINGFLI